MRTGLVLGGGGVIAQAYHAGVLAAVEHDLGWDPARASLVVGTSAGALTAALLQSGVRPAQLAAWCVGGPPTSTTVVAGLPTSRPTFAPLGLRAVLHPPHLPGRELLARLVRDPAALLGPAPLLTMVGDGPHDLSEHLAFLDDLPIRPDAPDVWVTAVRRRDGRRVVFGRGATETSRALAVAASCAVPGYFRPVRIRGHEYIDGGAHSGTNADLLHGEQIGLAIVIAPMSARGATGTSMLGAMRRVTARQLHREIARLERAGTAVLAFEPGPATITAMGADVMNVERVAGVVREGFLEAGRVLGRAESRIVRWLESPGDSAVPARRRHLHGARI
ncbi:MAG: patatin-like phospholipase family protein [Acidimicrobiia bacterium]